MVVVGIVTLPFMLINVVAVVALLVRHRSGRPVGTLEGVALTGLGGIHEAYWLTRRMVSDAFAGSWPSTIGDAARENFRCPGSRPPTEKAPGREWSGVRAGRRVGEVGTVTEAEDAMTGIDGSFTLARSRAYRIGLGAVFVIWTAVVISFLVSAVREGNRAFTVIPALMLIYGAVVVVRTARTRIEAAPDSLVVANPWRSYRIPRHDIAGFSTGRFQRVGHQTAYADLRSGGAVRLVVIEPQFPLPGRERAVEPVLDRLEDWRTRPRPTPAT